MIKQINHIQLRAARHALNLSTKDIADMLKVSNTTISGHERLRYDIQGAINFLFKHSKHLLEFFAKHNIVFPDNYSIELKVGDDVLNAIPKTGGELTRFQLRVARYILNITQKELSKLSGIEEHFFNTQEKKYNTALLYIHAKDATIESKCKQWFLSHGIEFFGKFKVGFKNLGAYSE